MHAYATANLHWAGAGWSAKGDAADLATLASQGATVIGVQEARKESLEAFLAAHSDWAAAYMAKPGHRVVTVLYRRDVYDCKYEFTAVPIGELGPLGAGEDRIEFKFVARPLLTDKATGVQFRAVNTHMVASAWRKTWIGTKARKAEGGRRQAAWRRQFAAYVTAFGDCGIGGLDANSTRPRLVANSPGITWVTYPGKTHATGAIDHVGARGTTLGAVVKVPLANSDHTALLVPFTLPAPPKEPTVAVSQNGFAANNRALIATRTVPGTSVRLAVRKGATGELLVDHVAKFFHENIEPIEGGGKGFHAADDWAYAERPIRGFSSGLSNHASGTAIDLNATRHPLGVTGTFTARQKQVMNAYLSDDLEGVVRWGENYTRRKDGMHFEIVGTEARCAEVLAKLKKPAKVYKPGERNVHEGDSGADVKWLQEALNKAGAKLDADGEFGPKTKAAVVAFEKRLAASGVKVNADDDGLVGVVTWKALGVAEPTVGGGKPKPEPVSPPRVTPKNHPGDLYTAVRAEFDKRAPRIDKGRTKAVAWAKRLDAVIEEGKEFA